MSPAAVGALALSDTQRRSAHMVCSLLLDYPDESFPSAYRPAVTRWLSYLSR